MVAWCISKDTYATADYGVEVKPAKKKLNPETPISYTSIST